LGHNWGMVHRTITGMSGLPRTLRTCHLPAEMFAASRSLWTGLFLTRKRSDSDHATGRVLLEGQHATDERPPGNRADNAVDGDRWNVLVEGLLEATDRSVGLGAEDPIDL
jgi:hypothetical protein